LVVLPEVIELLLCPYCGGRLSLAGSTLRCGVGHSFDVARQGYVNLLHGDRRLATGDTAAMVRARQAFLERGHFSGIRDAIIETAIQAVEEVPAAGSTRGCIAEVGAGTGYYLSGLLDRMPDRVGLALDISKFALRRAARAHERLGAVVCDTWQALPVRSRSAGLILNIFAPRNPPEFRRILEPEGRLIVVTPRACHLSELIRIFGLLEVDERKQERLEAKLAEGFVPVFSVRYAESLKLSPSEIAALAGMGPSAFHISAKEIARKSALLEDPTTVTLSVNISVYRGT
jgi:23S rRNA (guanine745-N1)-methyltransferase